MNLNEVAINRFKRELKDELKHELKHEIVNALEPHFNKINGRLETIEQHMARRCKGIQTLERAVSLQLREHGETLKSQGDTLK